MCSCAVKKLLTHFCGLVTEAVEVDSCGHGRACVDSSLFDFDPVTPQEC